MRFHCLRFVLIASVAFAADPIRVMLLDGESGGTYHKWELTTPVLKKQLEETGLFKVDAATNPVKPSFKGYAVIVWNYDVPDARWSAETKAAFEEYVKAGGGFVAVHAVDNAFPGWSAFNEMVGIGGWRGRTEKDGPYWFFKDGKLTSDAVP